jgi:hypothetical protein
MNTIVWFSGITSINSTKSHQNQIKIKSSKINSPSKNGTKTGNKNGNNNNLDRFDDASSFQFSDVRSEQSDLQSNYSYGPSNYSYGSAGAQNPASQNTQKRKYVKLGGARKNLKGNQQFGDNDDEQADPGNPLVLVF